MERYGHVWTWEGPRYGTALCIAFQELLERLREEVLCFQIMEQPCAFILSLVWQMVELVAEQADVRISQICLIAWATDEHERA